MADVKKKYDPREVMLDVHGLKVTFKSTGKEAVRGIDFFMKNGQRVGLVGESGSGKTVTAMAISGLIERYNVDIEGEILFNGKDLRTCSRDELRRIQGRGIGVVFQEPMTSLNPLMKIGQQIEETLVLHTKKNKEERYALVIEAMEKVGLPEPEVTYNKYPHQLSGGQRQRAMIASAFVVVPQLLICDEPTTALDVRVQAQILKLLRSLSEEYGVGILLISHDLRVIRHLCDRVAVIDQSVVRQLVQHMQLFGGGHPQQGGGKAVPGGLFPHEGALPAAFRPEEGAELFAHPKGEGREGIDRHVGTDLASVLPPALVPAVGGGGEV